MNEKTITINQLQHITGWSYPTAFKYAKLHGKKNSEGVWVIPSGIVDEMLVADIDQMLQRRSRFFEVTLGGC
jgi:hypothetical protein